MRQTFGPDEQWPEERTRQALAEIDAAKAYVQASRPWDAPDADVAWDGGSVVALFRAAEEEYGRSRSGHRVPIATMTEDVVESETTPGVYYTLRLRPDGTWWCDCPGYQYRGECKHATRKMEEMACRLPRR